MTVLAPIKSTGLRSTLAQGKCLPAISIMSLYFCPLLPCVVFVLRWPLSVCIKALQSLLTSSLC